MINGENQSMSILVSSTTFDSSFTNQRLKETEGDPHTYVVNARSWDVKPQNYNKERFYVFCGSGEIDPMILSTAADVNAILDSFGLKRVSLDTPVIDGINNIPIELRSQIIDVPIDFINDFKQNLLQSIQDIAGMTVAGQGKLFNNKEVFNKSIYVPEEPAFLKDTFTISTKLETLPQDYINPNWLPENPDKLRFMHIDQGISSDHYGMSSCFIDKVIINEDETVTLNVKFDFILNIIPPRPPAKVDISKVRSLIPWLAQNKSIRWGMITYDQYQSQESMQELDKAGFPVSYQSVDRTDEAYLLLVDYLYEEKVKMPYSAEFENNLFNLVHFREKRKVDHTCLTGDTMISLVDGREISIIDLLKEQKQGKQNWVYSFNEETQIIEPKPIIDVLETRIVNQIIEVELDNGEIIKSTLDHKFMMRNGTFIEAKDLKEGTALMPLSGNKLSEEQKNKISKNSSSYNWYNDGEKTHFCTPEKAKDNGWVPGRKISEYKNHKVKSVRIINVDNVQMYDLSIKDNHNFALSAGVFVHNSNGSKDISDSVAGSLYNAVKSDCFQNELVQNDLDILFSI